MIYKLDSMTGAELENLKKQVEKKLESRKEERFNELSNAFVDAYKRLVAEFPYCFIGIGGMLDDEGEEIDLNSHITAEDFRIEM